MPRSERDRRMQHPLPTPGHCEARAAPRASVERRSLPAAAPQLALCPKVRATLPRRRTPSSQRASRAHRTRLRPPRRRHAARAAPPRERAARLRSSGSARASPCGRGRPALAAVRRGRHPKAFARQCGQEKGQHTISRRADGSLAAAARARCAQAPVWEGLRRSSQERPFEPAGAPRAPPAAPRLPVFCAAKSRAPHGLPAASSDISTSLAPLSPAGGERRHRAAHNAPLQRPPAPR